MNMPSSRTIRRRPAAPPGWLRLGSAIVLVAVLASFLGMFPATSASAASRTFLIDSLSPVGDDANPGDGICATEDGECTLRAALQESNALGGADKIIIAPADDLDARTDGVQRSGTIVGDATTSAAYMYNGTLTPRGDLGAYFMATAPVTIDFQGRLGITSASKGNGATALYINGPDVTVRNFTNIKSNRTAFVVGPDGDGALLENGASIDPGSTLLRRFLWLADGADQVTVRKVEIGSLTTNEQPDHGAAIMFAAGATIDGFTLDRIRAYDPDAEPYALLRAQTSATLNNFTVSGSTFDGVSSAAGFFFDLRDTDVHDSKIIDNTFRQSTSSSLMYFTSTSGSSGNLISGNVFAQTMPKPMGVALTLAATEQNAWVVRDNYFDGLSSGAVTIIDRGVATVQQNTFSVTSGGGIGAASETNRDSMFTNVGDGANANLRTWYPVATSYDPEQCVLSVGVTPQAGNTIVTPVVPVEVDVFYLPAGAKSGAPVYLGSQTMTEAGELTVPYTLGTGSIRVQTTDALGRSSQYSRTISQTQADVCGPRVTVDQAMSQADPTSVRDIWFTAEFSEPLAETGYGALAASDFSTAGSTAPGLAVTSVTKLSDTEYRVIARANGSGDVVLSLPAGAVTDPLGNPSVASTSTDNRVTYVSPLTVSPTSLTVEEGGPAVGYTVSSSLAATADIEVTPTVGTPAWATVAPSTATISTIESKTSLLVTAVDDIDTNGTRRTPITHTVTSDDPNFDGLILPSVGLTVLDDDLLDVAATTLSVTGGSAVADGVDTHTATVTARNSSGGSVAGAQIVVSLSRGASPSTTTCTTSATGTCEVEITSRAPGSYFARATLDGFEVQGSPASVVFVAGAADASTSTISAAASELEADGSSQTEVTVQLRDSLGHRLTTSGGDVVITTDVGAVGATTDNGDGTYTAMLTAPEQVTTATVSFALDGISGKNTARVTFLAGVVSPARSTIVAADSELVADGSASTEVTVSLRDGFDNLVTDFAGDLVLSSTEGSLGAATNNGDGTYTATLTAPVTTGTAVLSFALDGVQATSTAMVRFVEGPVDLGLSTITAAPLEITADGTSMAVATVQLRDSQGNLITTGGNAVLVSTDLGTVRSTVNHQNGTYTATLTSATSPGQATLAYTVAGELAPGEATVSFIVGDADTATSTIEADPTEITADGSSTSTVTVRLRDSQGTALEGSGGTVVIASDLGEVSGTIDNGDGTYTATLTSVPTTGVATLTFTIGGATAESTTTVDLVPGPGDLTLSQISAAPTEILADGVSTSEVTVRLVDAQGTPLVKSGGSVSIFTDLGSVSSVDDTGDGTYSATLTSDTTAGTAHVGFTIGGVNAAGTAAVELTPGEVDLTGSTITATPETIDADGVSTSQVVVQLRDVNGNAVASSAGTVTISTDLGSIGEVTDVGDGSYTADLTSSETAGTATLTYTLDDASGEQSATVDFVAGALDLTASTIEATPASIRADGTTTSNITVRLTDAFGNPTGQPAGTVVIATDAGTVGETTDAGDGTYTAVLTSSTAAGTATVSFVLDGVAGEKTAQVSFTPGEVALAESTIEASPTSITADGVSTSTVTVRLVDVNGNPTGVPGGLVVISSDLGTVGQTTDAGDGTYSAELTSSVTAGTATVSFTLDGAKAPATAAVELTAGPVDAGVSTIEASPTSITADGVSTSTVTVRLLDANGNPLTSSGGEVVVLSSRGLVNETTDQGDGTYTAQLTSTTTSGVAAVGFTLDGTVAGPTTPVTFTAGPVDLGTSTIEASPTSITADGVSTSMVTVRLLDANGNPLTSSQGAVVIASDAGVISATTDAGDGSYTAVLTSSVTAGVAALTFTVDDQPGEATASVEFVAGSAQAGSSTIAASPTSITADGVSTSTVTVRLLDANGNPLTSSEGTVVIATDRGVITSTTDVGDGTYTAVLTSSVTAGTATVSFTLDDVAAEATVSVEFVAGPADAARTSIEVSPSTLVADGVSTGVVTVRVFDAQGNPATRGGELVGVTTDLGSVGPVTDQVDGTYTALLTSAPTVGTATVSFTLNEAAGEQTAPVVFVAGAADVSTSTVEADPTTITADGVSTSTLTVRLLDANGNALTTSGGVVVVSTDAGSVSSTSDNGDGSYTAVLTSAATSGTATASFTVDGVLAGSAATVDFVPGAVDVTRTTITASPGQIVADGLSTSLVRVALQDASGNLITSSRGTVVIATDAGSISGTTDVGDGTYTAVLTSATTAGVATVSFTVEGAAGEQSAQVAFVAGPASMSTSTIEASPEAILADGVSTSQVTVRLNDSHGNPLDSSGGTVVISTTTGTITPATDNGDGTYSATFTSAETPGTAVLSFTVGGVDAEATASVDLLVGAADAVTSTISASLLTLVVGDGVESVLTVQLRDAAGNDLTTSGGAVVISADAGTVTGTTDHGDGTYTAVLTAPVVAGQGTVSFTLDGARGAQTLVVSFTEGEASLATSQITATPATITADGVDASTVGVRLFDGYGNPLVVSGGTVVITTTQGDLTVTTDAGDGSYTATLTGTSTGTAVLGFSIDGNRASGTTQVELVAGAPDAGSSVISAAPEVITADGASTSALTVRLFDARGNAVTTGGALVTMSTDLGSVSQVGDNGDGSFTATLTSVTTTGTAAVSFVVDGTPGPGTASVEFVAGAPSAGTSTISATPLTIEAGGVDASVVTVQLVDAFGNPLTGGGADVVVTTTLGEATPAADNGDGTYSSTVTSGEVGTATVGYVVNSVVSEATVSVEVVDTTAPVAPVIDSPVDGARVRPSVQISGSGEPGANLTVLGGNGAEVCTVVVTTSGTWSCVPATPLPEGPATFVAYQVDASGNVSDQSAPVTVVVDGTAPAAPVLDATNGDLVSGSSEPGTTVTVRDSGGNVLCSARADEQGRFVCEPVERIPSGTLLSATATDEAGNVSDVSSVRVGGASVRLEAASLRPGMVQVAHGRGFLPGEDVSGLLQSTPVDLGTQVADAQGAVTFTFTVPAGIELGAHTVTLSGERSGDTTASFEVTAVPVEPTQPPTVSPGDTGAPAPVPTAPDHGGLAWTGASLTVTLAALAIVTLLGLLLLGAARRRKDHGEEA